MNSIVNFRQCTLSDKELIEKVDKMTDEIFITRKLPSMHIPARPNEDYDLLVGEVIRRYSELVDKLNV